MKTRFLILLAMLGLMGSANAFRVLEQPERPFELSLSALTLPKDVKGTVSLRECNNCGISSRRFADGAKFVVDGREVRYEDFLKVVSDLKSNSQTSDSIPANVYVDIATDKVTRVAVNRPRH
jgi:hypothetical protein